MFRRLDAVVWLVACVVLLVLYAARHETDAERFVRVVGCVRSCNCHGGRHCVTVVCYDVFRLLGVALWRLSACVQKCVGWLWCADRPGAAVLLPSCCPLTAFGLW